MSCTQCDMNGGDHQPWCPNAGQLTKSEQEAATRAPLPVDTNPQVFIDTFLIESMVAALGHYARYSWQAEQLASQLLRELHGKRHLSSQRFKKPLIEQFCREMEEHPFPDTWRWLLIAIDQQLSYWKGKM